MGDTKGDQETGLYDPSLHIFVDDAEVRHMANVHRVWVELNRRGQPLVEPDRPWEGGQRTQLGSVIFDEQREKFQCWYMVAHHDAPVNKKHMICYAESTDGLHWAKPNLGLHEWQGSRDNNICLTPAGMEPLDLNLPNVIRDENDPDPAARYKLFAYMQDERMYERRELWAVEHYVFRSPDGIHWTVPAENLHAGSASDRFMVAWDQRRMCWLAAMGQATGDARIRTIALKRSEDLYHWSKPIVPFKMDEREAYGFIYDHHTIMPFLYGNQYLGYFDLHGYYTRIRNELISSRDGEHWERPMRDVDFHRRGPDGEFDEDGGFFSYNPPIPVGDELYIYYSASGIGKTCVGLKTMKRDRFVGLECLSKFGDPAFVLTEPVEVLGSDLYLNLKTFAGGQVQVAVFSEDYGTIEGHELEQCQPITESGFRVKAVWTDRSGLRDLIGQSVVLRFVYRGATLYAYQFA